MILRLPGSVPVRRAVVHVGPVADDRPCRPARLSRLVVEIGVVGQVQRVALNRYVTRLLHRDQARGAVLRGDIGQIDERLELLVAGLGPRHDEHVVRVVGVQKLVEMRRLVRVLGRHQRHIETDVVGPEQLLGQVQEHRRA